MNKANNNNIGHNFGSLISKYGVPEHLTYDGTADQVRSKTILENHVKKHEIQTHRSAPRRQYENPPEVSIRENKRKWY